ncbi:MAG: hypothetical protein AAB893_00940 [Patescibacteria group bacterium]
MSKIKQLLYRYPNEGWLFLFLATYGIAFSRLPEQIPLYFAQILKEDRLGSKYELLYLPGVVYGSLVIGRWILLKLSLKNENMETLIIRSLMLFAAAGYFLFVRIIISVW